MSDSQPTHSTAIHRLLDHDYLRELVPALLLACATTRAPTTRALTLSRLPFLCLLTQQVSHSLVPFVQLLVAAVLPVSAMDGGREFSRTPAWCAVVSLTRVKIMLVAQRLGAGGAFAGLFSLPLQLGFHTLGHDRSTAVSPNVVSGLGLVPTGSAQLTVASGQEVDTFRYRARVDSLVKSHGCHGRGYWK